MNNNEFWIDHLRAIATFGVILLHTAVAPVPLFGNINNATWWIGNILDGSVRFCVPIFFMISGALLFSRDYTLGVFIKKRVLRLLPPFIFWSFIYIFFKVISKLNNGELSSTQEIIEFTINKLYYGSSYHMWFVYTILGLYLVVPIISKWLRAAKNKEVIYFLAIWGGLLLFNLPYISAHKPLIELRYFTGFLGYMVLGYYLKNKILPNRYALLLIIVGSLTTIVGTYIISKQAGEFDATLYSYLTPNVALNSIGIFVLLKNITIKNKKYRKTITFISNYSYGIYLVHVLVLIFLSKIGIDWKICSPLFSFIIIAVICLIFSSLIILVMHKMKLLKKMAG